MYENQGLCSWKKWNVLIWVKKIYENEGEEMCDTGWEGLKSPSWKWCLDRRKSPYNTFSFIKRHLDVHKCPPNIKCGSKALRENYVLIAVIVHRTRFSFMKRYLNRRKFPPNIKCSSKFVHPAIAGNAISECFRCMKIRGCAPEPPGGAYRPQLMNSAATQPRNFPRI